MEEEAAEEDNRSMQGRGNSSGSSSNGASRRSVAIEAMDEDENIK